MKFSKVGAVIFTFCRTDYLGQCLSSLENCKLSDEIDWHVYQDGLEGFPEHKPAYYKYSEKDLDAVEKMIGGTKLPIVTFSRNRKNMGINYQVNQAFRLFDDYDLLFFFEDDLVVSPYYLRLLWRCAEEHPNVVTSFHSIGIPNPPTMVRLRTMEKAQKPRLWGFSMTRKGWGNIQPFWEPHHKKKPRNPYYDVVVTQLARSHTKGKYQPLITRAHNIGIEGILSTNPVSWKHRDLHKQKKEIVFKEDAKIKDFILKKK